MQAEAIYGNRSAMTVVGSSGHNDIIGVIADECSNP